MPLRFLTLYPHDAGLSRLSGFVAVCLFIHALINTKPRDRLWGTLSLLLVPDALRGGIIGGNCRGRTDALRHTNLLYFRPKVQRIDVHARVGFAIALPAELNSHDAAENHNARLRRSVIA